MDFSRFMIGLWVIMFGVMVVELAWKSKEEHRPVDTDRAQPLTDRNPSPEAEMVAGEREARVQAAIAALPQEMREVVVLRDYEDLPHEEIAAIVGASPAAVRKRYSRALSRLGEMLQDVWP